MEKQKKWTLCIRKMPWLPNFQTHWRAKILGKKRNDIMTCQVFLKIWSTSLPLNFSDSSVLPDSESNGKPCYVSPPARWMWGARKGRLSTLPRKSKRTGPWLAGQLVTDEESSQKRMEIWIWWKHFSIFLVIYNVQLVQQSGACPLAFYLGTPKWSRKNATDVFS